MALMEYGISEKRRDDGEQTERKGAVKRRENSQQQRFAIAGSLSWF